jgi:protein phosphatase
MRRSVIAPLGGFSEYCFTSEMAFLFSCQNEPGLEHPECQDSWLALSDSGVFAVADGMSASAGGKLASQMALDCIKSSFDQEPEPPLSTHLVRAIENAHLAILRAATEQPKYYGMGTTVLALVAEGSHFTLAHVGDSRCYRYRHQKILCLTRDDVIEYSGKRVLSQAVGHESSLEVNVSSDTYLAEDVFLLLTDGVWSVLSDREIELTCMRYFSRAKSVPMDRLLNEIPKALVHLAKVKGSLDDLTALAFTAAPTTNDGAT